MISISRQEGVAHSATCARLYFEAVRGALGGGYSNAQLAAWAPELPQDDGWRERFRTGITIIAERGTRPVGFMLLAPGGHIDLAFVMPDERGKGTAAQLYDALLIEARDQGRTSLTTFASHFFRPFLERRSWRVTETEHVARNGETLTRFAMALDSLPDS